MNRTAAGKGFGRAASVRVGCGEVVAQGRAVARMVSG